MKQKALRKILWEEAGKAGLVLGLTSTAYLFLTQYLGSAQIYDKVKMLAAALLWAGKFGGCIYLMASYMKKFANQDKAIDNKTVLRFGLAASLLSAMIYAAASFANTAYISSELIHEQFDILMQQMAPMMDSNSLSQIDEMMANLPQITFFSNLFYCFIYGGVLSLILSHIIPSKNPFENNTPDQQ